MSRITEPRIIEVSMIQLLTRVWREAESLIIFGLFPLLAHWASQALPISRMDDDVSNNDTLKAILPLANRLKSMISSGNIDVSGNVFQSVLSLARQLPLPGILIPNAVTFNSIERQIEWIRLLLGYWFTEMNINGQLVRIGDKINNRVVKELGAVLKVDIRRDMPELQIFIDRWRGDNIALIESGIKAPYISPKLRPSLLEDVSKVVENAHHKGLRVEELMTQINGRFDVGRSRAALIARDQVLKLNGQINRHRQMSVGIEQYKWVTSRDGRVRGTHRKLHGTIQSWDNPPDVGRGRHEHPGGDYQCRCTASPVMPIEFALE